MDRKEISYTVIILLVITLVFNFFIWQELAEIKEAQYDKVERHDLERLERQINFAINKMNEVIAQNKWIQEKTFELDKEKSSFDNIFLRGEWTFGELEQDQIPYLLLKEEKDETWRKINLKKEGLLTCSAVLELKPDKRYQYKLIAEGESIKASEEMQVPYDKYGFPGWQVRGMGWSGSDGSIQVEFDFELESYPQTPPIEEMKPIKAYLEIYHSGKYVKTIPFEESQKGAEGLSARWVLEDKNSAREYALYSVVEFKNGLKQRKRVEMYDRWLEREVKSW